MKKFLILGLASLSLVGCGEPSVFDKPEFKITMGEMDKLNSEGKVLEKWKELKVLMAQNNISEKEFDRVTRNYESELGRKYPELKKHSPCWDRDRDIFLDHPICTKTVGELLKDAFEYDKKTKE